MQRPRRRFLHLAAGAAAVPAVSRFAWAQTYPSRPVRLVVGFPAGGGVDITARLMAHWLSERLGQQVIVDNRPGAASNVAAEAVARAPADGYTLLLAGSAAAINTTLYDKLSFNFLHDIAPVAGIIQMPNVMQVHPSVPAKTVAEFIAYAKNNPGKINMGSAGNGTVSHVAGELLKLMTGVSMVHVPYRGAAPAIADLLGNQVQVVFVDMVSSIEHVRAGKLRALALTSATRWPALPDIPTVSETVPGYEASVFYGLAAPTSTPTEIVARLNREVNAALANPEMKARLAELGGTVLGGSPNAFGKLIADETAKWGKVVKFAGIKAE